MDFSLAYLNSPEKLFVKQYSNNSLIEEKFIPIDDFEGCDIPKGIIVSDHLDENELLGEWLNGERNYSPILKNQNLDLGWDHFQQLDYDQAKEITSKIQSSWVLNHNMTLLEELFSVASHLKSTYPNDRTSFFEELWDILRRNIGAQNLKLVFNDIDPDNKKKLLKVMVSGKRKPEPIESEEIGTKLLNLYEGNFTEQLDVQQFEPETGTLVMTTAIHQSPLLIMAEVTSINKFQTTLIQSLLNGINQLG